jgi:DNA topoisomerase I
MAHHRDVGREQATPVVDPRAAAESAGLVYVGDDEPGFTRRRAGKGFSYRDAHGQCIRAPDVLARIRQLAVPPAYADVWICARPDGHLQATGRDARGRKQYRYHAAFRALRDTAKYTHMLEFAELLPTIRRRVAADMAQGGLPRDKVLATVVHLLETTMIRIGNKDYAAQNRSYGLTTLRTRHVSVGRSELRFAFKGKSGKSWRVSLKDRRVAKIMRALQDLPGQHLFQYLDEDGARHDVGSEDVNAYLREISGAAITAKDFRTWTGTVLAALALSQFDPFDSLTAAKAYVRTAIDQVAARLGNTATICRTCYIHPHILESYLAGDMRIAFPDAGEAGQGDDTAHRPEEALVLAFLRQRLQT